MLSAVVLALSVVGAHCISPYGHEEYHHEAPAHYSFAYEVKDTHTGDIKSHHEERNGDSTKGEYSLVEPDGSRRVVQYSVEGKSGFNAVVHREGGKHPSYSAPSHYAAPAYSAPSHYAAPKYDAPAYSHGHASSYSSVNLHHAPAPAYHAPAPAYHAPAVYHAPAPAYHAPAPSYHAPAPSYGHGHATSSTSFSTHGAKISTSTYHHAPAPKKYY